MEATQLISLSIVIAMVLGVFASSVLHLSQGMMRLGLMRLQLNKADSVARWTYLAGLMMNFSAPLWVMVANLFAPTIWFTSMFATGLVALMVFSRLVMHEPLSNWQVTGAALILVSTALLAFGGLGPLSPTSLSLTALLVTTLIWLSLAPLLGWLMRSARLGLQEAAFGAMAGGFLALDALWKRLAQTSTDGSLSFLPTEPFGWLLLLASFIGAGGAFAMMQWSFLRHCRASAVVVGYNVMYVLLPLFLVTFLSGQATMGAAPLVALCLLLTGAALTSRRPSADKRQD